MELDSYMDAGVLVAIGLVNGLPGRADVEQVAGCSAWNAIAAVLVGDPPSVAELRIDHVPAFELLASQLRNVFADLRSGQIDAAADRLNALLAACPAYPHLAKEDGVWRLHHHPVEAGLVPMWTAICAEGLARMLGAGHADRFGSCAAGDCAQLFFDVSKNASRRFCSVTCQNRSKTAAFRRRRARA